MTYCRWALEKPEVRLRPDVGPVTPELAKRLRRVAALHRRYRAGRDALIRQAHAEDGVRAIARLVDLTIQASCASSHERPIAHPCNVLKRHSK
jgi:hypothetical protein